MHRTILLLTLIFATTLPAFAQWEDGRTQIFSDIVIPAGHKVEEATCFFCSIRVEGELKDGATSQWGDVQVSGVVDGDVVAVGGAVRLAEHALVKGDSVSVFGDTHLGAGATVNGDAVASIGSLQLSPGATVGKTSKPSPWPVVQYLPARARTIAVLWLIGMGTSLVLGYASLFLLRKPRLDRLADAMRMRRWRSLVLGIVVFGLLVAAIQVGGDSQYEEWIELPLIILLLSLMAPGYTAIGLRLGERYVRGSRAALLLGIFLLVTLQVVPFVGWLLSPVLMIFSLGSLPAALALRLPVNSAPVTGNQ